MKLNQKCQENNGKLFVHHVLSKKSVEISILGFHIFQKGNKSPRNGNLNVKCLQR